MAATINGRFAVNAEGRQLALRCWGDGSPTVVFDAGTGTSGISEFEDSSILRELAGRTRVCSYDRAGLGMSDAAPVRKRVLDDAATSAATAFNAARLGNPSSIPQAYGQAAKRPGLDTHRVEHRAQQQSCARVFATDARPKRV